MKIVKIPKFKSLLEGTLITLLAYKRGGIYYMLQPLLTRGRDLKPIVITLTPRCKIPLALKEYIDEPSPLIGTPHNVYMFSFTS
jgi:hypothetical protein